MTAKPPKTDRPEIDTRLFVGSVRKAMRVMEAFDHEERAMTLSRIADKTGLGRSAAQRFVYTLEILGYLRRDPETLAYQLSNRAFRFVRNILSANTTLDKSFHLLSRLAEQTGEAVSWVEREDNEIVIISTIPSPNRTAIALPVGARFGILTAASGQLFLADQSPDAVRVIFDGADAVARARLGDQTAEAYLAMIAREKAQGYSFTEKDFDLSSLSISAPVRDFRGRMIAAINVSILRARMQPDEVRAQLVPLLLQTAEAVSANAIG